ncbi:neurotrimin isoform X2 [Scleropages formosus]|uniref:neurotrimin isoform X2 n=1 Tax=Scleropages formosus TaxID=113540 RepID=UPI0010FA83C3|nr:opioid-binding protein/cell adhesion molecule homolog isoform X2 [Scleropages formosus]
MDRPVCWLILTGMALLFIQQGLPVRSQGDPQSDSRVMDNITVRQGESVLLRCPQGNIVTHTAWLNRSSILYAGEDKWSVDPRVSLVTLNQEEFTIKIENVDIPDEGQYICAVQTRSRPRTASVHIIVQVPPKIMNLSKDIVVNEGSNVTLMCLASGKPEPSITWKLLSPGVNSFASEDDYLEIPSISRHKAGTYECTAVNEVSADVQTVEIVVNYPPSVSESRDVGASVGQQAVLHCEAEAEPPADFEWYKDDKRIFNSFDGIEIDNTGRLSMLTFFNVSEVDYGNYTCIATNKLGSANTSTVLYEVIEPTSSTLLQDKTSVLEKGTSSDYTIWEGPGAVQDGNCGNMGAHASLCLLVVIVVQLLLKF